MNADGEKEILACEKLGDSIFVEIRNLSDKRLFRFFAVTKDQYTKPYSVWGCSLNFVDLVDINEDGRKDLLFLVHTTEAGSPRGLFAFDGQTGQILWKYLMGAAPFNEIKIMDLDEDGVHEYALGTAAPGNVSLPRNGTDDFHTYFFIFDKRGNILYRKEFPNSRGKYCRVKTGDLNGDGIKECILLHNIGWPGIAKSLTTELYIFDKNKIRLIPLLEWKKAFKDFIVSDVNRDGKEEILLSDLKGEISIYQFDETSGAIKLLSIYQFPDPFRNLAPVLRTTGDLDNDGFEELLVVAEDCFLVLNHEFRLLALYKGIKDQIIHIAENGLSKKECSLKPMIKLVYSNLFKILIMR